MTFAQMQLDLVRRRRGALSLPLTGIINYGAAAVASLFVPKAYANFVLALCFWAIPPVAALIGRIRKEDFRGDPGNPLFELAKLARIMVLSTWTIHLLVWIHAPALFPATVGVAFGLHWVIFGWSIGHRLGLVHLGLRATLVPAAWYAVPDNRMGAVAAAVTLCYLVSVLQLRSLSWQDLAERSMQSQSGRDSP
ncbi:MAG: hypothetical protein QOG72_394 [Sphingomonadales bacterium]|jgi:hypothetical protein|nr:hypothetical protein [Sphingomonadales bacterium]